MITLHAWWSGRQASSFGAQHDRPCKHSTTQHRRTFNPHDVPSQGMLGRPAASPDGCVHPLWCRQGGVAWLAHVARSEGATNGCGLDGSMIVGVGVQRQASLHSQGKA